MSSSTRSHNKVPVQQLLLEHQCNMANMIRKLQQQHVTTSPNNQQLLHIIFPITRKWGKRSKKQNEEETRKNKPPSWWLPGMNENVEQEGFETQRKEWKIRRSPMRHHCSRIWSRMKRKKKGKKTKKSKLETRTLLNKSQGGKRGWHAKIGSSEAFDEQEKRDARRSRATRRCRRNMQVEQEAEARCKLSKGWNRTSGRSVRLCCLCINYRKKHCKNQRKWGYISRWKRKRAKSSSKASRNLKIGC